MRMKIKTQWKPLLAAVCAMTLLASCVAAPSQETPSEPTPSVSSSQPEPPPEPPEPELPVPRLELLCDEGFYDFLPYHNGYACVLRGEDGKEIGYIDMEGNVTTAYSLDGMPDETLDKVTAIIKQDYCYVSEEGLYPYYDKESGKWGYGNIKTGEIAIPPKYDQCGPFASGCAVGVADGQYEIIDASGKVLATPVKVFTGYYQKDRIIVSMDPNMGTLDDGAPAYNAALLNPSGNVVYDKFLLKPSDQVNAIGFQPDYILDRGDPNTMHIALYTSSTGGRSGIYDLDGNFLYQWEKSTATGVVSEGITLYRNSAFDPETIGYIRMGDTEPLTEQIYISQANFSEGRCWVMKKGDKLYSLIDDTGKEILPPTSLIGTGFQKGYAPVAIPGEGDSYTVRIIDRDGNFVSGPDQDVWNYYPDAGLYVYRTPDGTRILSTMDGKIVPTDEIENFYSAADATEDGSLIRVVTQDETEKNTGYYYRYIKA